jgi:hypothetical protein
MNMGWLFLPWAFRFAGTQVPHHGTAEPTVIDLLLIRVTYTIGVTTTTCGKCGARLGRVQVSPSFRDNLPAWPVLIRARCRGWRRHRHLAHATEASGDLQLEPIRMLNRKEVHQ